MPPPDLDFWRAAYLLMKRHGSDAAIVASEHADKLLPPDVTIDGQFEGRLQKSVSVGAHRPASPISFR